MRGTNPLTSPVDIRPDHLEIVQDILIKNLPAGVKVWVFGSRANWTTKDSSDLDLALEGEGKLSHTVLGALKDAFEDSSLPYTVDVVDFNRIGDAFKQIVELQRTPLPTISRSLGMRGECCMPIQFGECASLVRNTVSPLSVSSCPYIGLEHIGENTLSLVGQGRSCDVTSAKTKFQKGDILFGKLRPYFRKVVRAPFDGICSTDIWVVRSRNGVDQGFLYYNMASHSFVNYANAGSTGTKMPRANWDHVETHEIFVPPLPEQRAIAHILGTLDDKIELNRRMNETLEAIARALFKSWFVDFDPVRAKMAGRDTGLPPHIAALFPDRLVASELGEIPAGWEVKPLDEVAQFRNGLALQKFRPEQDEEWLPVLKIAQLRNGYADGKEKASANIRPEFIVDDGDIVFSWSGSLLVKTWCGGRAALNQHLFKVTSRKYPKWLVLQQVKSHLAEFQAIAAGKATTMGHIKRQHLTDALCAIPDEQLLAAANSPFADMFDRRIASDIQSRSIATLRDALLPKLMSGEVKV